MSANEMRKLMESVTEGGMPSGVIKAKQRFEAMSPEEFRERMDTFFAERSITDDAAKEHALRQMAWRHGYGKMSPAYYDKYMSALTENEEDFDWRGEMETGVVITDNTRGGYDLSAEGKSVGNFSEWDDVMFAATQWMEQNQYWPNIFFVNDHGNVTHIDQNGNEINSIVETPINEGPVDVDEFCEAYIEAALWSSTDNADEQGGEPLDRNYGIGDISKETFDQMKADCDAFQEAAGDAIVEDASRAGHDFWLTRNGHGAGFWDGDWEEPAASQLTALSKRFGEFDLYVGDDGMIYS